MRLITPDLHQAEDALAGVARLRPRGHGPDLDVAEAEGRQAAPAQPVFVEPVANPTASREGQPERLHRANGCGGSEAALNSPRAALTAPPIRKRAIVT